MRVKVTVGTTYCGCPSESFYIECDSVEDFEKNDVYSTEILNQLTCCGLSHYFMDYEYEEDEDDKDFEVEYEEEDGFWYYTIYEYGEEIDSGHTAVVNLELFDQDTVEDYILAWCR